MKPKALAATVLAIAAAAAVLAAPSVFPTGTTIYDPAKAWNGYTVLSPLRGNAAVVIDMSGNIVKRWEGFNSAAGGPVRILPGGVAIGAEGSLPGQQAPSLVARDFSGTELWRFDRNEQIEGEDGQLTWVLRQHHDWQREDLPAGYYSPNATPADSMAPPEKTLILTKTMHAREAVAGDATLSDDRLIELGPDGELLWEWSVGDHIEEFGFDDDARQAIRNGAGRGAFDWFHMNSATYLGPNHWYEEGDERFAPDNIIFSSRSASIVAIVNRAGNIVWQIGPDYSATPEMRAIRQVIGQHHAHFIPKGLPGAGNVMVFDNGGASGYGRPTAMAAKGSNIYARPTSRILEINPDTLELVWSYTSSTFFGTNISGAQRLGNGNTLITEGPSGRIFEVTTEGDIVWEYIYPEYQSAGKGAASNSVYRAYRLPYEWLPQLPRPTEEAVTPPIASEFRVN